MDLDQRKRRAALLSGREVRRITVPRLSVRSDGGQLFFNGYASTTGQEYDMGWYAEEVQPGAFRKTLAASPDVQFLTNHDGLPMARTTIRTPPGILTLREDNIGFGWEAVCDGADPDAATLARKIDQGLLDQCSFAFRATSAWDEDYTKRTIIEVDMDRGDVSVVNYGANPNTTVGVSARSHVAQLLEVGDAELAELRSDPLVIALVRKLGLPVDVAAPPTPVGLELFRARAYASRLRQAQ